MLMILHAYSTVTSTCSGDVLQNSTLIKHHGSGVSLLWACCSWWLSLWLTMTLRRHPRILVSCVHGPGTAAVMAVAVVPPWQPRCGPSLRLRCAPRPLPHCVPQSQPARARERSSVWLSMSACSLVMCGCLRTPCAVVLS